MERNPPTNQHAGKVKIEYIQEYYEIVVKGLAFNGGKYKYEKTTYK